MSSELSATSFFGEESFLGDRSDCDLNVADLTGHRKSFPPCGVLAATVTLISHRWLTSVFLGGLAPTITNGAFPLPYF